KPMHSPLGTRPAEGALSGKASRHTFVTCPLARRLAEELAAEALALRPAHVHAHQHLGPVCESVPPAPAWMLTRAGWSAYGPENRRSTSCLPRSASRDFNSADSSLSRWPSFLAFAISARPARSFARDSSLRQVVTSSRKPFASWASR